MQRIRRSAREGQLCGVRFSPEPPSKSAFTTDHTRGRVRPRGGAAPRPCAAGTLTCTSRCTGTLGAAAGGKAVDSARGPSASLSALSGNCRVHPCGEDSPLRERNHWDMGRPLLWGCSRHSSPSKVPLHTSLWAFCCDVPVLSRILSGFLWESPDNRVLQSDLPPLSWVCVFGSPAEPVCSFPLAPGLRAMADVERGHRPCSLSALTLQIPASADTMCSGSRRPVPTTGAPERRPLLASPR